MRKVPPIDRQCIQRHTCSNNYNAIDTQLSRSGLFVYIIMIPIPLYGHSEWHHVHVLIDYKNHYGTMYSVRVCVHWLPWCNCTCLGICIIFDEFFIENRDTYFTFSSAVSFVMSYSFTDSKGDDPLSNTVMVPFVDLLNHHHNHNAELSYHPTHLRLVAIRDIKKVGGAFQLIPTH